MNRSGEQIPRIRRPPPFRGCASSGIGPRRSQSWFPIVSQQTRLLNAEAKRYSERARYLSRTTERLVAPLYENFLANSST